MPFVQMENISHFLRACQAPPFNLHQHDMFLTVDLYEQKDPAQVLQCLGAFSRAAYDAHPNRFPEPIGPKSRGGTGALSPQTSGYASPSVLRGRGASVNSSSSSTYAPKPPLPQRRGDATSPGRQSPAKGPRAGPGSPPGPLGSWGSTRAHEGSAAPAWNIAQYGYMGGASQGNLGISFGGMRQITTAGPHVPTLADKERRRKEEARRQEDQDRQRRAQLEAEEEAARREEERRWEEETHRLHEEERQKAEEEKRRWEEQELQWKLTEERRRKEEQEAETRLVDERQKARGRSDTPRLRGQLLSQYQAEQAETERRANHRSSHHRSSQLEKELERARQREDQYEKERQNRSSSRLGSEIVPAKPRSRSRHRRASPTPSAPPAVGPRRTQSRFESWTRDDERGYLQDAAKPTFDTPPDSPPDSPPGPMPDPTLDPTPERVRPEQPAVDNHRPRPAPPQGTSPRPLPEPNATLKAKSPNADNGAGARPLPDPTKYASPPTSAQNRAERFLAASKPSSQSPPRQTYAQELGFSEERDSEDRRRVQVQAQAQTKAGGWASKSLLEQEMEMERQRQREWEEAQKKTAQAVRSNDGVDGIGGGIGGRWDVGQWSGYTGGDSQNKGSQGIGSGKRQIVGPRPLPGSNR
ncbi:hypothetical protein UVI_02026160 [Ustilaginoidea virens]|nr:hypothetical protein UVI_02026160 [Ustilaginoidea virens]